MDNSTLAFRRKDCCSIKDVSSAIEVKEHALGIDMLLPLVEPD